MLLGPAPTSPRSSWARLLATLNTLHVDMLRRSLTRPSHVNALSLVSRTASIGTVSVKSSRSLKQAVISLVPFIFFCQFKRPSRNRVES